MARTFKQYGCAHDTSGSLNVVVTVGGVEVYNGAVTADTDAHVDGDKPENELFSFELDEAVSGDTSWEVTVTGTDDTADLGLGKLECNGVGHPNVTIPLSYFLDKAKANGDDWSVPFSAEDQAYIANTVGETRLGTEVYNKLLAGTSQPTVDAPVIMVANEEEGEDLTHFMRVDKTLSNGQLNGEAYDVTPEGMWPIVGNGETLTMTANLTIPTWAYDPAF